MALAVSIPFSIVIGFLSSVTTIALGEVSQIFLLFGWVVAIFIFLMEMKGGYLLLLHNLLAITSVFNAWA
jgi:hypothetical protein